MIYCFIDDFEVLDFHCNDFGFTFNIGVSYLGIYKTSMANIASVGRKLIKLVYAYGRMYVRMCVYAYVRMCVRMCVCVCVCAYVCVCVCVCMCVCVYETMNVWTYDLSF